MEARPGRRPAPPRGEYSSLTLRLPSPVKQYLIDASEALDMSITEYLITLISRDAGGLQ